MLLLRRPFLWGLGILLVSGAGGLAAWAWLVHPVARITGRPRVSDKSQGALEKLEVYGQVPEFSLIERSGRRVSRGDLLGKVWVANFFYTECSETCPLQSANMARLQADLSEEREVRLVSISLDPGHDTPEMLSEYANRFRADPDRWLFLTGSKDAIYRLAIEGFRLGVVDPGGQAQRQTGKGQAWLGPTSVWAHPFPNAERKPLIHSSRFVLVDRQAQIRGYYHGTDWQSLARLRENLLVVIRS